MHIVRLVGLKATSLNGKPGTITGYVELTGRYGVLLHGDSASKAINPMNIVEYTPEHDERCEFCEELLNLFAFPPCSCNINGQTGKEDEEAVFGACKTSPAIGGASSKDCQYKDNKNKRRAAPLSANG